MVRASLRETLKQRLDEIVVLEITQEGGRQYYHFTVRELYNHVLKAITKLPLTRHSLYLANGLPPSPKRRRRASVSLEGPLNHADLPNPQNEDFEQSQNSLLLSNQGGSSSHHHHHRTASGDVTYRERLGAHLHPRDMRRLVTPFSLSNQPELIVRRHVMLLNFDPLRAIILRDRLLVLVPDGADSLLETLEKRVRAGAAGEENDIFGESPDKLPASSSVKPSEVEQLLPNKEPNPEGEVHLSAFHSGRNNSNNDVSRYDDDNEMDELKTRTWTNLPFELQCVDAVLHGVSELLSCQAYDIQKEALLSINWILKPGAGVGALARERLRTSKNNVRTIVSRINGFVRALTMLLNDDADMALMNLSRLISHPDRFIQPVSPQVLEEESDEPELILEAYLQQAVTLTNELETIKGQLQTTEGLINMKSDTLRNRILFVNMMSAIVMMAVTMSLFITGIFAMNVPVRLYMGDNGHFFRPVMITIVTAPFVVVGVIFLLLKRIGILSTV